MVAGERLQVEVVFCPADGGAQVQVVPLPAGATVADALRVSGFASRLADATLSVGVWGRVCRLDRPLASGDRVELYRPLLIDPMEARRARQRQQAAVKAGRKVAGRAG